MNDFVKVANIDELEDGEMKMVSKEGREFLVARVGDKFYAADNRCPHMGGDLSLGKLEGTIVTCPRHHSQFDLVDGHLIRWTDWKGIKLSLAKRLKKPSPINTYELKIEEKAILIKIN